MNINPFSLLLVKSFFLVPPVNTLRSSTITPPLQQRNLAVPSLPSPNRSLISHYDHNRSRRISPPQPASRHRRSPVARGTRRGPDAREVGSSARLVSMERRVGGVPRLALAFRARSRVTAGCCECQSRCRSLASSRSVGKSSSHVGAKRFALSVCQSVGKSSSVPVMHDGGSGRGVNSAARESRPHNRGAPSPGQGDLRELSRPL